MRRVSARARGLARSASADSTTSASADSKRPWSASAEEADWTCPANAEGIASRVRELLSVDFHNGNDQHGLDENFRQLEIMSLHSGHCSAAARSTGRETPGRDNNIEEWHAMNQWLSRLVNVMGLNVRGDIRRTWRDEYELFAEIYEFDP